MSQPFIITGAGGSATPGGNNGDIQFNNNGVLGGEALVPLAHGGTNADLSASGGTTAILAQDASHVITARNLVAADIPNLDASKITTGALALARGGTNADLSASGSATAFLAQAANHVVSARSIATTDLPTVPGHIWLGDPDYSASAGGTTSVGVANRLLLVRIRFAVPYSVKSISAKVTTASAATTFNVGIYTSAGNLVVDSGAMSSAAIAVVTATITPVVIPAGDYYLCLACTSTVPVFTSWTADGRLTFGNAVFSMLAFGTNTLSGGALPATTGAISAQSSQGPPVILLTSF